jgi:hypothetical protein
MKKYTLYLLFLLFASSIALSPSLTAQAHNVKGPQEIPVGPGATDVMIKIRNANGEVATDLTVYLHGGGNITMVDILNKEDMVDDDYLKSLDDGEDDQMVDPPRPHARAIISGQHNISDQDSVAVRILFDTLTAVGAKLTVRFSTKDDVGLHSDMVENTGLGLPGATTLLFLPPGANGATSRLINETGDYIAAVGVMLPEQPLKDLYLEAPYENSEIQLGTGRESMIFFNPPLAPFDQARLYVNMPEPLGQQGAHMQFITLESFPPECPLNVASLQVSDCGPDNTYDISIDVNLNGAVRRSKEYTFTNNLDQSVNDLHATFSGTGGDLKTVILKNALGCAMPQVNNGDEVSNRMDVVWPAACIKPGESVRIRVSSTNGAPKFEGGYWTVNGRDVGALKESDVSEGPEYGAGSDGLEYYLDGELVLQSPAISGPQSIENKPGSEAPVTLTIVYTGELGCEFTQTFIPPVCGGQFPLDCERMHLPDQEIPLAEYPIIEVAAGTTVHYENPSPITDFWVFPPEMLELENAYQCGRDYRAVTDQPQLPATYVDLTLDRSGPYLVRYQTMAGEVFTEILYVDTESTRNEFGETNCLTAKYKEIPCGDPDLAVLSSTNGSPNRWGEPGVFATSLDSAKALICRIHEERGDSLYLVINAHGASGSVIIGGDTLTIENVAAFATAIKGKVKKVSLMSCNVALGESGRAFVCALEQNLGVNVASYTGVVAVTKTGEAVWYTTGEPYSWERTTSATNASSAWIPPTLVYPNPFSTAITVRVSSSTFTPLRLRLFRTDGSLVREELFRQSPAEAAYEMQLTAEPAGIYFLQVEVNGATSVQRLVKVN